MGAIRRLRCLNPGGDVGARDIVALVGDQPLGAVRPKRRVDAGRAASLVIAREDRTAGVERVEKRQEVGAQSGLLTGARRILEPKRVGPNPRKYGTMTRVPCEASLGATAS